MKSLQEVHFGKKVVAASNGEWVPAHVKISTRGITAQGFMMWFTSGGATTHAEVIAAHPEHWAIYVDMAKGIPCVFKTIGDKPTWCFTKIDGKAGPLVVDDPSMPIKNTGHGYLGGFDQVHIMEVS